MISMASNDTKRSLNKHDFVILQVDVVVDENYAYDPTTSDLTSFLTTYNITGNATAGNATYPFLRRAAVFRCVSCSECCCCMGMSVCTCELPAFASSFEKVDCM